MPKPVCKICGTALEPIANKNKGYYVGCPNKANHTAEAKPDSAPAPKPDAAPAPPPAPPAATPAKTLFGW
jgi:hypothetical protein